MKQWPSGADIARCFGIPVMAVIDARAMAHTFHYSQSATPLAPVARASTLDGRAGEPIYRRGRLTASYVHFYFPSNPEAVARLLLP